MSACGFEWDGNECQRPEGHAGAHEDVLGRWPAGIPWPHPNAPDWDPEPLCEGQDAYLCGHPDECFNRRAWDKHHASSLCYDHLEKEGLL